MTRDRRELVAEWNGRAFMLVDTGGWLRPGEAGPHRRAARARREGDRAGRGRDARGRSRAARGRRHHRHHRGGRARRQGAAAAARCRCIVVVNKVDGENRELDAHQFLRLGLGDPWPVSAIHGRRVGRAARRGGRRAARTAAVDKDGEATTTERDGIFSVAIVGRPNVGKSTLFNRLVGEERSVVHDLPGTTRDAIDTVVETEDGPLRFVDTAGLRRKSQIDEPSRVLQPRARARGDRPGRCRTVPHRRVGGRDQPGPAPGRTGRRGGHRDRARAQQVGPARHRAAGGGARARLPTSSASCRTRRCCRSPRSPAGGCTTCSRRCARRRRRTTRGCRPRRSTACSATRRPSHPPPIVKRHRPRILYATQGATDPPTFTLFTTRALPPISTCGISSASCGSRSTSGRRRSSSGSAAATSRPRAGRVHVTCTDARLARSCQRP